MKASYTFAFISVLGRNCLTIIDEFDPQNPTTTVTNIIEDVVEEIFQKVVLDYTPNNCVIVYRDSEGEWAGWDHQTQSFKPVIGNNGREAAESYIERYETVEY